MPEMPTSPRRALRLALGAGFLALCLHLPFVGEADFVGDDEALDAAVVREMVHSGDWLFPEFNGEILPPKPPLFYWAAAAVSKLHGRVDEWSVRLPSVLAGAAMVAVTVAGGAALVGEGPAFLGGLLLAATRVAHDQSRIGRCDMTMAALVVAALFLYGQTPADPSRRRRWIFYTLLGFATLAKAAVGPGLVLFVVLADALVERRLRALGRWLDSSVLAMVVIGSSWFAAAAAHWGARFIDQQILAENVRHLVTGPASGPGGTRPLLHELLYFGSLFRETLPWGLLVIPALFAYARRPAALRSRGERFLIVWIGAGLAFFTLAARKSPYYLLPIAPPVLLLAARWAYDATAHAFAADPFGGFRARATRAGMAATVGILLLVGVSANLAGLDAGDALREAVAAHPLFGVVASAILVAFAGRALAAVAGGEWGAAMCAAWPACAAVFLLIDMAEGPLARAQSLRSFAIEIDRHTRPEDRIFFLRIPLPAIALYSERRYSTLRDLSHTPPPPFHAIVPENLEAKLPEEWQRSGTTVAKGEGRVFTRKRMAIRLVRIDASEAGLRWTFACATGGG